MRFPGDRLQQIRAGKLTVALRPFEGRTSGYRVGNYFSIERVDDVPKLWQDLEPSEQVKYPGAGPGDTVYVRKVEKLEEWVRIAARERSVLDELDDDVVAAAGFEGREQLVDFFRADYGGPSYQTVWAFDFVYAEGVHLLPGLPAEPEAVDPGTLERFVVEAHQGDVLRHAKRRRRWERRSLAERAAELEELQAGGANLGRHIARVRDAIEAAEREAKRRAA